jgi:hypothetical protein
MHPEITYKNTRKVERKPRTFLARLRLASSTLGDFPTNSRPGSSRQLCNAPSLPGDQALRQCLFVQLQPLHHECPHHWPDGDAIQSSYV